MNTNVKVIQMAYLDLIGHVFVFLRNGQISERQQLYDLGDALHNVSGILGRYGEWIDDQDYRRIYLSAYDTKWGHKGLNLEVFLDERIKFYSADAA